MSFETTAGGAFGDPESYDRELAAIIDHTNLRADARAADIERLCREAVRYGFASVCVNPARTAPAVRLLRDSGVAVCTVVGFPLGAVPAAVKQAEARIAREEGATEMDMVIHIGAALDGEWESVADDIRGVVEAAEGAHVKVILETCYLEREQIVRAARVAIEAGAHFVKTSTGFGPKGASVENVRLLRETAGPDIGVKAAGGIRNRAQALAMREAGASRIGASSSTALIRLD